MTIFGSWFDGHLDTVPKPFELSWLDFCDALVGQFTVREDKYGNGGKGPSCAGNAPGFSLARFVDIGDGSPINRDKRHVDVLSGVVLDFDKNYDPESVFSCVDGLAWFAYTTFSHLADGRQAKWRLVVPFAMPIPGSAYKSVRNWLLARIDSTQKRNEADAAASATSNFYFGPGCPESRVHLAEWRAGEGQFLALPPLSEFKHGTPSTRLLGDKIDWDWLKAKMRAHKDDAMRRAFQAVLKGKPFADAGARDQTLMRMCGALAGWALQCDPEHLASVFGPSLVAMNAENPDDPPPDVANAADKIARSQASLLAKAKDEAELRVADAQTVDERAPLPDDRVAADAAAAGLPDVDALRRRLILYRGHSHWLWRADLGTWIGPLSELETLASARQELPLVPGVMVWQRKADGGLRMKITGELLQDYGERVDRLTYDLCLERAVYDVNKRELRLVGAPRRPDLVPTYHAFVDEWLNALGGAKAEKLLDWVAGLTWHDRPNAILFLQGSKGVGKSLLLRGLSRVWDCDGATSVKRVADAFNAELLRCPLLRIEEGKWSKHVDATAMLRDLVTEASRTINRKYHDEVELVGHLRFVVTANDFNLFASDSHALTPDARDAIAERFLEITPSPRASELMLSLPPEERDALAADNHIAAHALWLAENRKVKSPGRFVVGGDLGRFAVRIITEDGRYGTWTMEWLARWLSSPNDVEKEVGAAKLWRGEGRAIVSPEAVVDTFERALKNRRPPQSLEISNALCSLSHTGELVAFPNGKGRGFDVIVEEVAVWSAEKGIGDPAKIRSNAHGSVGGGAGTGAAKVLNMGGKK